MKICMISGTALPVIGGVQFQIKYLTEELTKQGVELILLYQPSFFEVYQVCKRMHVDVIHVHSAEGAAVKVALLKLFGLVQQPFIVVSYGIDIMTCKEVGYGHRLHFFRRLAIRFILKMCSRHIIGGKSMKPFALDAGTKQKQLVFVPNGVPLNLPEISAAKRIKVLEKYNLSGPSHMLLSLSGMRPLKGIEYLVQAFQRVLKEFPDAKLLLTGKDTKADGYEDRIRELVDDLHLQHAVTFIGFITDEEEKRVLLERCDVFCKPSLLEACSVAILEAMREGKVVIASEPGGMDILTHERNGLMTRVKDEEDFAKAVIRVFKDHELRSRLETNAKEDVQAFDIQKIAEKYQSLYAVVKQLPQ